MRLAEAADGVLAGKQVASSFAIASNQWNRGVLATLLTNLFPLSEIIFVSQFLVFDELSKRF